MNDKTIVFVNGDHIEGQIAKWLCNRSMGDKVEIIELRQNAPRPFVKDRKVVFFGVSFDIGKMKLLQNEAREFYVFENDVESKREIAGLHNAKFDMKKTAARFAWDFFRKPFQITVVGNKYNVTGTSWFIDFSIDAKRHKWPKINRQMLAYGVMDILDQRTQEEGFDLLSVSDPLAVVTTGVTAVAKEEQQKHKEKEENESEKTRVEQNERTPRSNPVVSTDKKTSRRKRSKKTKVSVDPASSGRGSDKT